MMSHFLRINQIVGQSEVTPEQATVNRISGKGPCTPRPAIPPLLPISKSSFWAGVKSGRYPQPSKLGPRTTVWLAKDIFNIIEGVPPTQSVD